jgi:leucyl aminopeptidase
MKIKFIENLDQYLGIIIIPTFETHEKNVVPISFHGVEVTSNIFFGKKDTHYIVEKYSCTHIFVGLGKDIDYKAIKTIFRRVSHKLKDNFLKNVAFVLPSTFSNLQTEAAISGLLLGTYQLGHFKKTTPHLFTENDFELNILGNTNQEEAIAKGVKIAAAQLEVFRLVDLPPNQATPTFLSNWVKATGEKFGFSVTILNKQECFDKGLHAFLAVGQGSHREPQFVIMEYVPKNASKKTAHIGLVGKGITFDTGGLNIKTAGMVHMKCDMAGGAAVLGAMQLIADLQVDKKVTAIVPFCENSVDSLSFLPSDVIQSYAGHSIEIIDTDAEGRLILADGLSYLIKNYQPQTIVDIATLTGSSVATFGYECGALFSNNEEISNKLQFSGNKTGERLWALPLWDCYKQDVESEIADVKNYSGKPVAGAISAAKFLEFFTENHSSWAHLDVAGVSFGDDEFAKTKHSTAFGVHLLYDFIENY